MNQHPYSSPSSLLDARSGSQERLAGDSGLSALDIGLVARSVGGLGVLQDDKFHRLLAVASHRRVNRGEQLLRAGQPASQIGIVLEGLLREFFLTPCGIERTKSFVPAGHMTGSLPDLVSGEPSRTFIVAEETSRVLLMGYEALRGLVAHSPSIKDLYVRALERVLLEKAEREYELLALDAGARYSCFARRSPGLEARVSARHVASYLGITSVHLSRLRRRRREQRRPFGT